MKNLKQLTCSLEVCEEYCQKSLRAKSNPWECKQLISKWISSFQSWFVCQNRGDQLCLTYCFFTKKRPRLNLRRLTSSQERSKEYCTVASPNETDLMMMKTTIFKAAFEFSVVIWASKSRRPPLHFMLQLHQKGFNTYSETANMLLSQLRRVLNIQPPKETDLLRMQTNHLQNDFWVFSCDSMWNSRRPTSHFIL